jgi:hypothetical protein
MVVILLLKLTLNFNRFFQIRKNCFKKSLNFITVGMASTL